MPGPSSSLSGGGPTGEELGVAGLPASPSASSSRAAGRGRAFATRRARLLVALVSRDLAPSRPPVPASARLRPPLTRRQAGAAATGAPRAPAAPRSPAPRGARTCSQPLGDGRAGHRARRHWRTKTPPPRSCGAGGAGPGWDLYDPIFPATGRERGKL